MNRRQFIATATLATVAGCTDIQMDSREERDQDAPAPSPEYALEILEASGSQNALGNPIVHGIAQNATKRTMEYAEIEVLFYNRSDVRIGQGLDNTTNLAPGEKWEFECAGYGIEVHRVEDTKIYTTHYFV